MYVNSSRGNRIQQIHSSCTCRQRGESDVSFKSGQHMRIKWSLIRLCISGPIVNLCEAVYLQSKFKRIQLTIKVELWLLKGTTARGSKQRRKAEKRKPAAAVQFSWLVLFYLFLPIQVCLANFLILRLRMKPYSMK